MGVQGRLLLSAAVLTRLSSLSSDGKISAKLRNLANAGMGSPEPMSVTQL